MNEAPKIQVTNTGKALISRVEGETSISEVVVSNSGITGQIRKKSLPEVDLAGEVVFSDLASSNLTNSEGDFLFQAESRVMRKWVEEIQQVIAGLSVPDQNEQAVSRLNLLAALIESYPEFIRDVTTETRTLI